MVVLCAVVGTGKVVLLSEAEVVLLPPAASPEALLLGANVEEGEVAAMVAVRVAVEGADVLVIMSGSAKGVVIAGDIS